MDSIQSMLLLALGLGKETEMNQPMGIAVIGGACDINFINIYIVPTVYSLMNREDAVD